MLKKSFLWNMAFEICKYMNQLNTFIYFFFFLAKHSIIWRLWGLIVMSFNLKCSLISNNYYYL